MHSIPELDRKGLREFGLVTGAIIAGLFGIFFPWLFDMSSPLWPWVVFAILGVWALVLPESLRPVYRNWMRFGLLLSKVTTPIIMGVLYYLLIVPMALLLKLRGWDAMRRTLDHNCHSYRVETQAPPRKNLEKPF